jgi:replicative DNA helicase
MANQGAGVLTNELIDTAELVVGSALAHPDELLAEVSRRITPADISDSRLRHVYEAMLELGRGGDAIDPVTVSAALKQSGKLDKAGGHAYLIELFGIGGITPVGLETHVRQLRTDARSRRFERVLRQGLEELDMKRDPVMVMSRVQSELQELGGAFDDQVQDDMVQHAVTLMSKLEPGVKRGKEWPWPAFDDAVGLMMDGRLYLVSGFSGSGKSTFLRPLALGLAMMGIKVAYFSIEESADEVLGYMACALTGVSYTRFGWGLALTEDEVRAIAEGVNAIHETKNLRINNEKSWKPAQLLAKARYYIEEEDYEVVIVDHGHRMNIPGSREQREDAIGDFTKNFKILMQNTGGKGVLAYQPKKPGEGGDIFRPVEPDEIRGTSVNWNEADNTFSPYRPWVEVDEYSGRTKLGANGMPIIKKPYDENAEPAIEHFFIQPGKRRVGGVAGRPIILRFDPISARLSDL